MRRLLLVLSAVAVVAASIAGVSGAFSGGNATTHASMPMPMPMPSTTTAAARAAAARPTYELHQAVVHAKILNFAFKPARLVVSPGTKVVWTNEDQDPHTVTSDRPGFGSQALDTGSSFTMVAQRAGTFTYHCVIHPFMHGTLVVEG
jgi:plastocyanin